MADKKNVLRIKQDGLNINANIRTSKLDAEKEASPEFVRRDAKTGQKVSRQYYDKGTGDDLNDGFGYYHVNEDGEEVPKEDIEYYQIFDDDHEEKVEPFEATMGAERTLKPTKWIPEQEADEFLISKMYEVYGEEDEDDAQLWDLAQYIDETGQAPVVNVVFRKGMKRYFGILTPYHDGDKFGMLLQLTVKKVNPTHEMETLTLDEVEEEQEDLNEPEMDDPF